MQENVFCEIYFWVWGKKRVDRTHSILNRAQCSTGDRWVPQLLTEDHKGQQRAITSELLQRYQHKGDDFLFCIVTGDESWFHHFEPEMKQQSME
ncbi:hypothetical protein B7P43_G18386 [Cryptotermes secundus]|uniref:Uncharacterized protein n=1 Tax=Cryptotermes secundus TaxID=105785 RepID=A0A2J7RNL3_9NEOP|nr:hypothetical protein B7P43_G18386 [Cryptotermes secundus]